MSFQSLRRVLRSARKGLCSTCSKARYPQLEAAGAGHVGCLIYTFETLGQLIKDDHDVTAVHVAARKGQIPILVYLIENNLLEGVVHRAKNGATAIHDAAGTGQLSCLRYLASHTRLSVNDIDVNNSTPLHWAVQSGHLKVAVWLIVECKVSIDCVSKNGVTPLHLAASRNHLELMKWLVRHAYKHVEKPRRLVNAKDKNGATPLYHAAQAGHMEIIQWLAEKAGGDPTIRSNQGLAPLHAATIAGHLSAVQYLFQFGSASAPGGLRTSEGACALHFAAAEGFSSVLKWLLSQNECTGNERDYYQSTPLHDAAERGHFKNLQILCEGGADISLTDVEGNVPQDLADKNGQNKCAKYLNNQRKQKTGKQSKAVSRSGNLSRSKTTRAEMIDSYRNAPPHQIPVSVFEGEDEDDIDGAPDSEWATLRDLMGESTAEMEDGLGDSGGSDRLAVFSEADKKRRKLEEDMRREAEERTKKRQELLKQETDIEQEIRKKLLSDDPDNQVITRKAPETGHLYKKSRSSSSIAPTSAEGRQRRLSLPPVLSPDADLSQKGLVEKRTKEFEEITPRSVQKKSNLLSKLRRSKKGSSKGTKIGHSQSWDSGVGASLAPNNVDDSYADEEELPEPPPVPSIEYLLGKRPVNLRKRASDSLKREMSAREGGDDDSDEHSSVSSSTSDQKHSAYKKRRHKRRGSKEGDEDVVHKRRGSNESDEDLVQWSYNKLTVPQSSPPRERKVLLGVERHPTPIPRPIPPVTNGHPTTNKLLSPLRLDTAFNEVSRELLSLSDTDSSLSPTSPKSPASPTHTSAHTAGQNPSRLAPKPSANFQNKLIANSNTNNNNSTDTSRAIVRRASPISKVVSSRGKSKGGANKSTLSDKQAAQILEAAKSPTHFMSALSEAISSSPKLPRFMRQEGLDRDHTTTTPPESSSPTIDEIELQLNEMRKTLESSKSITPPPKLPPSPDTESESESSEYTSSSEGSSSEDDDSDSSSDSETTGPKRPIMVRNVGMSASSKRGNGVFNRARALARYPRLLRRNLIRLEPILEVTEEVIFGAATVEERAKLFRRLKLEKRHMKAWRKYMQVMRSAYRKAERIIQRKRRELLARFFYSWIQVRNMGAVEEVNTDRALYHYQRSLVAKMFRAWHFHLRGPNMPITRTTSHQWLNAEERYLNWINQQLLPATGSQIADIEESLANGVLIIKAIAYASNTNPPKYLARPRVRLHCQDNWKTAHGFMRSVGINMYGIEPADLANVVPAAVHNMFNTILKWEESR